MTLQFAKAYINDAIKEGYAEAEDFEGMTDHELIAWADMAAWKAEYDWDLSQDER